MRARQKAGETCGETGFTMIEMIIGMGLSLVAILIMFQLTTQTFGFAKAGQIKDGLIEKRAAVFELLTNTLAVEKIVSDAENASFACVRGGTACTDTIFHPVRIRDVDGNVVDFIHDPVVLPSTRVGFTDGGVSCSDFDATAGNPNCPNRIRVSWRPACTSACPVMEIVWKVEFDYKPGGETPARNASLLNFETRINYRHTTSAPSQVGLSVGDLSSCVWFADGKAKCWGRNNYGNVSPDPTFIVPTPVDVNDAGGSVMTGIKEIAVGMTFACARLDTGEVKCWGANDYGQLGRGLPAISPTNVPPGRGPLETREGAFMQPAQEHMYQQADYVRTDSGTRLTGVTSLYARANSACAKTVSGLYCWGDIYDFWFDTTSAVVDSVLVTPTVFPRAYGWNPSPANSYTEYRRVGFAVPFNAPAGFLWDDFALGHSGACFVVTGQGEVTCWGTNNFGGLIGQPGESPGRIFNFDKDRRIAKVGAHRTADGVGGGADLRDIKSVHLGYAFFCGLETPSGKVVCWGNNHYGQMGRGATDLPAECSFTDESCIPNYVKTSTGDLSGMVELATGWYTACARNAASEVYCWGKSWYGEAGDGAAGGTSPGDSHGHHVAYAQKVMGLPPGVAVRKLEMGVFFSCALMANDEVYCWGLNTQGQIGDGTTNSPALAPTKVIF